MAELPKVEQQNTGQLLRDVKAEVARTGREADEVRAVLQRVWDMLKQNEFYEREIDSARGRIFVLLVAQLRNAEVTHVEEFETQIDVAIEALTSDGKEEEKV